MTCTPCKVFGWFLLNVLIGIDVFANILLLGRPPETISQRLARLRIYGGPRYAWIGEWFCAVITWIGRLFGGSRDHCTWALDTAAGHDGHEIWRWSK